MQKLSRKTKRALANLDSLDSESIIVTVGNTSQTLEDLGIAINNTIKNVTIVHSGTIHYNPKDTADDTNGKLPTEYRIDGFESVRTAQFYASVNTDITVITKYISDVRSNDGFRVLWDTEISGSTNSNQIQLPLIDSGVNDFIVEWGDGKTDTITAWDQSETLHTYQNPGKYTVRITGTIQGWQFAGTGDKDKILNIRTWGDFDFFNNACFSGCGNMSISAQDIPTITAADMSSTFRSCTSLESIPSVGQWDMSGVDRINRMFESSGFNGNIDSWDVSNVTTTNRTFNFCPNFNSPLNSWDLSSCTNISEMFRGAEVFNQPLNNWNVGNVTNMTGVFRAATVFNQPLDNWDMSSVTTTSFMFASTPAFNSAIDGWTLTNWDSCTFMFQFANDFNQPVGNWTFPALKSFNGLFRDANAFNQPLNNWDVSGITNFRRMFRGADLFNQPLNLWNTSSATRMDEMFRDSTSFDQDIGSFDIANCSNFTNMFLNAELSTTNYDSLLIGWEAQTVKPNEAFHGGTSKYSTAAAPARQRLIDDDGWTIIDGGPA